MMLEMRKRHEERSKEMKEEVSATSLLEVASLLDPENSHFGRFDPHTLSPGEERRGVRVQPLLLELEPEDVEAALGVRQSDLERPWHAATSEASRVRVGVRDYRRFAPHQCTLTA